MTRRVVSLPATLRDRAGLLAVSGGALLWGTTGVALRIVHDRSGLSAVSIGWHRVAIAALVVALVVRTGGIRRAAEAFRRHPVALVISGVGFGAYQALYFVGVQDVGVSVSTRSPAVGWCTSAWCPPCWRTGCSTGACARPHPRSRGC